MADTSTYYGAGYFFSNAGMGGELRIGTFATGGASGANSVGFSMFVGYEDVSSGTPISSFQLESGATLSVGFGSSGTSLETHYVYVGYGANSSGTFHLQGSLSVQDGS